jgi:hypothetical protein
LTDLTLIEDVDSLPTATEDLQIVFLDGSLRVSDSRNILDHNDVIRVLSLANADSFRTNFGGLVWELIGINHVVNDAILADPFALELWLCGEVVAIVISKMIIQSDRQQLDPCTDEELGQDGLQLCLAGFEVVSSADLINDL